MVRRRFLSVCLVTLLGGCGGPSAIVTPTRVAPADRARVDHLYQHYREWRGVRYREGGLSRQGVDCSGFVYLAYRSKFNRRIPRTTELLAQSGNTVHPEELRPGDLVFFRTGWKTRHVGIYVEQGKFMHASSSRGVMMSRLDNPYWRDAWWMARRL